MGQARSREQAHAVDHTYLQEMSLSRAMRKTTETKSQATGVDQQPRKAQTRLQATKGIRAPAGVPALAEALREPLLPAPFGARGYGRQAGWSHLG